jgi:hypothetical protein
LCEGSSPQWAIIIIIEIHQHFKLDKKVIYDVCSLYDAEGLYAINPGVHSPLHWPVL